MSSGGPVRQPCWQCWSARLHRLAESIPELLNIFKFGLRSLYCPFKGGGRFMQTPYWTVLNCRTYTVTPEVGVLVRKLSRLTPLSYAKRGLTPGISYCSVDSAVSQPAVYTSLTPSQRQPAVTKPNLSQLCLAKPAKLNFFKTSDSASITVAETHTHTQGQIMIIWALSMPTSLRLFVSGSLW